VVGFFQHLNPHKTVLFQQTRRPDIVTQYPGVNGIDAELAKAVITYRPQRFTGISLTLSLRDEGISDIGFMRVFTADAQADITDGLTLSIAQHKHAGIRAARSKQGALRRFIEHFAHKAHHFAIATQAEEKRPVGFRKRRKQQSGGC